MVQLISWFCSVCWVHNKKRAKMVGGEIGQHFQAITAGLLILMEVNRFCKQDCVLETGHDCPPNQRLFRFEAAQRGDVEGRTGRDSKGDPNVIVIDVRASHDWDEQGEDQRGRAGRGHEVRLLD